MSDNGPELPTRVPPPGKKRGRKAKIHTVGLFLRKTSIKRKNGEVYEYEGKIWQICYSAPDPKTGKPKMIFESSRTENKTLAEKFLDQRKQEVLKKAHPHAVPKDDPTITSFIDDVYLLDKDTLALAGLKERKQILNEVKLHLGRIKLNALKYEQIKAYMAQKEARGNVVATVNRHISAIKKVYSLAYEKGAISEDTMTQVRRIKKSTERNERIRYLTLTEIPVLIEKAARFPHLQDIIRFAVHTGVRKGKIYYLEWSMIDMEHCFIKLPKDKWGPRFDAPLGVGAMAVLKERFAVKRDDSPYVFFDPETGDHWKDLKGAFNKCVKDAGIVDFHFHDLRHTFISHIVMAGVPLATVSKLAGHKSMTMTMRYAHLNPQTLAAAVAKLPF